MDYNSNSTIRYKIRNESLLLSPPSTYIPSPQKVVIVNTFSFILSEKNFCMYLHFTCIHF